MMTMMMMRGTHHDNARRGKGDVNRGAANDKKSDLEKLTCTTSKWMAQKYLPIRQNVPIRQGSESTSKFYNLRKFLGGLNALCTLKKLGEGKRSKNSCPWGKSWSTDLISANFVIFYNFVSASGASSSPKPTVPAQPTWMSCRITLDRVPAWLESHFKKQVGWGTCLDNPS